MYYWLFQTSSPEANISQPVFTEPSGAADYRENPLLNMNNTNELNDSKIMMPKPLANSTPLKNVIFLQNSL